MTAERVLLAWSSGKDSALSLHLLREQGVEVVGLLTTINEGFDRVAMHTARVALLRAQAEAARRRGDVVERDGFAFADALPETSAQESGSRRARVSGQAEPGA